MNFSRREFFKGIGFVALPVLFRNVPQDDEAFEMLVVGDSLIWGQGLEEKDKFYTLVKNWIQNKQNVKVNLKVKAHCAATIYVHLKEAKFQQKANEINFQEFQPEVGSPFPSLKDQIESAKNEYSDPQKVNLVMLTGGLVDIQVAGILNPYNSNEDLRNKIKKYCCEDMKSFLEYSTRIFPNALFVVVGYYPIISDSTDIGKMFNAFLEAYSFPTHLKFLVNNSVGQQFFRRVRRKAIIRSTIWFEESNLNFQTAVDQINSQSGKIRAIFVKSPINAKNAFEADETFLFKINKKGRTDDNLYGERVIKCQKTRSAMKEKLGYEDSVRQCEISSMGHPNAKGAALYANTIIEQLKPYLQQQV